jgi:Co/Zn/Cd efflux system component
MADCRISMGGHHHHDHGDSLGEHKRILWTVLLLNLAMFFLEIWQGLQAQSTSLLADSMDFLSDAFSYGLTIYVLRKALHARARASLIKASLMLLLAAGAIGQGVYNLLHQHTPEYTTMGWVGLLALMINITCTFLLFSIRSRDSNMRSVWLCSRNDAIANILILVAAALVYATGSLWPDLLVALGIAGLGTTSALRIIADAKLELKTDHPHGH